MRRLATLVLAVLVVAGFGYGGKLYFEYLKYPADIDPETERISDMAEPGSGMRFHCQGKTRCSQMSSCAEAMFYIENCPNTEMDGDGDGIPCERQWCK